MLGGEGRTSRERMVWYSAFTLACMSVSAVKGASVAAPLTSTDSTHFAMLLRYRGNGA